MLDVDGTLVPDTLAGPLPALLVEAGLAPRDRYSRWPGQPSEPTMTANTILALWPYQRAHQTTLTRATDFLLKQQKPDGTFERSWSLSEANSMLRALTPSKQRDTTTPQVTQAA